MKEKQLLSEEKHPFPECKNRYYHSPFFNDESADALALHLEKRSAMGEKKLVRIAPLCEFGGIAWKTPFGEGDREEAGGTWAVCHTHCQMPQTVMACAWSDRSGVNPKQCTKCGAFLENADYFQPVYGK